MIRRFGSATTLALIAVVLAASVVSATSPDQVERGKVPYRKNCGACHGLQGDDGFAVPLVGTGCLGRFGSVRELYEFTAANEPKGKPGSLDSQTYFDILAVVLAFRGVEPDGQELSESTLDTTALIAPGGEVGPQQSRCAARSQARGTVIWLGIVAAVAVVAIIVILFVRRRRRSTGTA